ncbi:hypothetical protein BJV77DRAFT_1016894 [Russula vinacea]|nr:hypothetical protein BJV77DRAFT_1016894 [Russula vinacea]
MILSPLAPAYPFSLRILMTLLSTISQPTNKSGSRSASTDLKCYPLSGSSRWVPWVLTTLRLPHGVHVESQFCILSPRSHTIPKLNVVHHSVEWLCG